MKVNLCIRRPSVSASASSSASTSNNHRPLGNLFARLDDNTARRLCSLAQDRLEELYSFRGPNRGRSSTSSGLWAVSDAAFSTRVESGVEFLPLRIEIRSDQTQGDDGDGDEENVNVIYASYNGGSVHLTSPEQQRSAMELDQHLLPDSLSASARSLDVDVRPLPVIYKAESVHLEPLSAKDWELLEIHADELESGSLLSQVCVIFPNQRLPIRLGRYRDIAWVKVLGNGFDRSGHHAGSESDSECSSDGFNNLDDVCHECLRLVANTEILVVSKLRADDSPERSLPICNLRVYPNDKDYSSEMKDLFAISSDVQNIHGGSEITSISIPKCPPWFTGAVHSSTFGALDSQTNGENEANAIDQNKVVRATITRGDGSPSISTKAVALIVIADDVPRGCIVLHPALRRQYWESIRSVVRSTCKFCMVIPSKSRTGLCKVKSNAVTSRSMYLLLKRSNRQLESHGDFLWELGFLGATLSRIDPCFNYFIYLVRMKPKTMCRFVPEQLYLASWWLKNKRVKTITICLCCLSRGKIISIQKLI